MIITKLKGGLGNQMFQYATGFAVALSQGEKLKIDVTGYDDPRYVNANTPRAYRMSAFNLSGTVATNEEANKARNPFGILSKIMRFVNQRILKKYYEDYDSNFFKKKHTYIEGYFQSEKNFAEVKEKLFEEFTLKKEFESDLFLVEKNKIDKTKSISVHIRRGDYVNDPKINATHGVCSEEYYKQAIQFMRSKIEKPIFYFFSDDIDWVKNKFGEHSDFSYVSNPNLQDYEELFLMATCANNIIANSSFSWWGAYLNRNPNKIVIMPKKWVNKESNPHRNIAPEGWYKM